MSTPEQILGEFIDAWNAGAASRRRRLPRARPQGGARRARASSSRPGCEIAPTPAYDEATRARIAEEPALRGALDAAAAAALAARRAAADAARAGGAGGRATSRGASSPSSTSTTSSAPPSTWSRLERDELDAGRLSRRLLDALAAILGADRDELAAGPAGLRRRAGVLPRRGGRRPLDRRGHRRALARGARAGARTRWTSSTASSSAAPAAERALPCTPIAAAPLASDAASQPAAAAASSTDARPAIIAAKRRAAQGGRQARKRRAVDARRWHRRPARRDSRSQTASCRPVLDLLLELLVAAGESEGVQPVERGDRRDPEAGGDQHDVVERRLAVDHRPDACRRREQLGGERVGLDLARVRRLPAERLEGVDRDRARRGGSADARARGRA